MLSLVVLDLQSYGWNTVRDVGDRPHGMFAEMAGVTISPGELGSNQQRLQPQMSYCIAEINIDSAAPSIIHSV